MQAFREGNERRAQRQLEREAKREAKKLKKVLKKVLTKRRVCDILLKLSRESSELDLEN